MSPSAYLPKSDSPKRLKPAELEVVLREGLKLSDKPTISDFSDARVQSLLSQATKHYESMIITRGPFPTHAAQAQRVRLCWDDAQVKEGRKAEDGSLLKFELTERMVRVVKNRGSRVRGLFLGDARHIVQARYGLVKSDGPRRTAKNINTVGLLISEDKYYFHYKDPKTRSGYLDNPAIMDILAEVCFGAEDAFGVMYKADFNPIPLETLAFIFTLIYFCLKEWSTGDRIKTNFTEAELDKHYKVFLADLTNWGDLNTMATTLKRTKLYERAKKRGGVVEFDPKPQLTGDDKERARQELDAYTGLSDVEDDEGSDDFESGDI
ncbi:hypothetical protein H0H92_011675 [Tricholoma furcatifolium]|nr:hypothetical protein H0H92_011675 [Tricholoma furcatifolium]